MKLKNSDARKDINELQEDLIIDIDSFIYQLDLTMMANPFLIEERDCYSALKFHYDNNICNIFKDKELVSDIVDTLTSDMRSSYDILETFKKMPPEMAKKVDIKKLGLIKQLSALCDANIHKISQLYLIEQFNSLEFLSYALKGSSRFSEYFNITKIKDDLNKDRNDYYDRNQKSPERKIEAHHLLGALKLFVHSYEGFLEKECELSPDNFDSDTIHSILHNPMKIVLDTLYQKSKTSIDNLNLTSKYF